MHICIIYIYIYIHISEERVWSPQCFCWLECAQCVYSWTRTLLGGLWNVHNFCDTCTSSEKRAQLLENVHNISKTCTNRIRDNTGWGRWNTLYPYIYIYTCKYVCACADSYWPGTSDTLDFSCASSLVLVIATTCWQGNHKASSNTKKLKLLYNICIYRRRNTTFTRLFLNNEMSLSLTGFLMCVMRSCAMQQSMFASSAQKRSFSFASLFVKYFVLTKTYDCLY